MSEASWDIILETASARTGESNCKTAISMRSVLSTRMLDCFGRETNVSMSFKIDLFLSQRKNCPARVHVGSKLIDSSKWDCPTISVKFFAIYILVARKKYSLKSFLQWLFSFISKNSLRPIQINEKSKIFANLHQFHCISYFFYMINFNKIEDNLII